VRHYRYSLTAFSDRC